MLIGWQGRIFVGLGSDHTDRKVETYSVTVSKQMCDKVMAPCCGNSRMSSATGTR